MCFIAFDVVARVTYRLDGAGVQRMRENYARLLGITNGRALERVVKRGLRSYLRYWCEMFRLPAMTAQQIRASVRTVRLDIMREAHGPNADGDKHAVACFLGHMGNWDLAGAWAQIEVGQVVTVAEHLEPEAVFARFLRAREAVGMRVHALTGGADVLRLLIREMKEPVIVPLLADRDLTGGGVAVQFPGGTVSMAVGPAALAIRTGAQLVPVTMRYEKVSKRVVPSGYRNVLTFHPPVVDPGGTTGERVRAMTQQCADALASEIRAHPHDWHMMQPFYADDLTGMVGDSRATTTDRSA